MMSPLRVAACAGSTFFLLSCTHVVGFHPVKLPVEVDSKAGVSLRLYVAPELKSASHSFRAAGSGIANKWVIDYGARVHEFAVTYLSAAFTDFREVQSPADSGAEVLLTIQSIEYHVARQAVEVSMDVEATDASGAAVFSKRYSTRGWSGSGAILAGGVFAQKGVTRSSTDQALREIFLTLIEDLRSALGA